LLQAAIKKHPNNIEKAMQLLELEYQNRPTLDKFDNAIEILENRFKPSVFISLQNTTI
jgi:hypothetical protein